MALFVGGFLIFNSFNMTVFQRTREIGMLRTLGAGRWRITGSVLREAALLGVLGAAIGLGLGVLLALGLIELMRRSTFPSGSSPSRPSRRSPPWRPGCSRRSSARSTRRAVPAARRRSGRCSGPRGFGRRLRARRAVAGAALIPLGLAGAFWLGAADETTTIVAAAGMLGTLAIFFGIALVAPFVIRPLVRALSWPFRSLFPVEGRLAADAARSDPGRTAATATALMIGLALVVAVNSLGSSFLKSISDEFDRSFARDLTVQPHGFAPGQGPQQTIAKGLRNRLARIPEAKVVARERFLFTSRPPGVAEGRRARTACCWGSPRRSTSRWTQTDIEGAPRAQVFARMERGWVTLGKGWADETGLGVGDPITLRGPSGTRRTRVAGVVETVVFGGQTVSMSLRTMRERLRRDRGLRARPEGDLRRRPSGPAPTGWSASSVTTTRTWPCSPTTSSSRRSRTR